MESHRRRLSIDPASVESILSGGTSPPAAPPSPHVGNSPNREQFSMAPPPRPAANHSRALSYTPRVRPNRLSLSFPIAPITNGGESARQTPTSSNATSFPPTPVEPTPSVNDPTEFLVALAGQERRVLELKEELVKAERDLARLKKQWATHEAHKKRAEIKHVEPMQPLQVAANGNPKDDGPTSARQSLDMDRRKMLLSNINIPKESRRKIITGGHTRTLSLLSPERSNYPRPFPPVRESSSEYQSENMSKPSTMPDTSQGITRVSSLRARPLSYQGSVTHNAKIIAEDFKAGMWTFLEDLRQATVGDEAALNDPAKNQQSLSVKAPVRKISRGSLRNDKNRKVPSPRSASPRTWETLTGTPASDAAGWSDSDTPRPSKTSVGVKKTSKSISLAAPDLDDDWSNWDSPTPKSPRWSSSTAPSDPATPSHGNMDDRAVKIVDPSSDGEVSTPSKQTGDIQWPAAIDKLTPSNLRRTLTNAITDWERSLSPAQEQEDPLTTSNSKNHANRNDPTHEEALMLSR